MKTLKTAAKVLGICMFVPLLSNCAHKQPPCEEILEVKRQERECAELKKIMNDKEHPQQALTARQRFDEECVNLRYYRDEYDTICKKGEKPIGKREE